MGSAPALLAVCLLGWASTTNYTNHAPLIPVLMASLGFGPAGAGLLTTATFVTLALAMVPAGVASDRLGPKRVGALGLGLTFAANLALGLARDLADLLVLKAVAGAGAGIAFVAGVRYATVAFAGPDRYRSQGLYGGAVQFGGGTSIYLLPLLERQLGWRGAFVASALLVGLSLAAWLRLAPDRRAGRPASRFGDALASAAVRRLAVVHAATFGISMILGTWIPTFLVHDLGRSLVAAGVLGSTVLVAGVVARPLGGQVIDRRRLGPDAVMRLAMALSAGAVLVLALPGRPLALAVPAIVVLGAALSLPYAAVMTAASVALPASPGAAVAMVGGTGVLAAAAGAPAVGLLFRATGSFSWPFAGLALLGLAALAATWRPGRPGAGAGAGPGRGQTGG